VDLQPINIGVLLFRQVWFGYFLVWVNFICDLPKRDFGIKVETDNTEYLRKVLLNSGISSDIAEKIVAHYTKEAESV
jgi:hypothetical protein